MANKALPKDSAKRKQAEWWHDFFPAFRPLFDIYPAKTTREDVAYLIRKLGLKPGSTFLDCPCGIGRISIPLAKKGIRVTGVDITKSYLVELAAKSKRLDLRIDTVHCDMRRINFNSRFDAAGNLFTSFGYFEKESDNQLVLKKVFQALKPDGKFMISVINRDWIIKNYTPKNWDKLSNGMVFEERYFDYSRSVNMGTWRFVKDGKESVHSLGLRMYSYHELLGMMKRAGFVDIVGFGSMKDEPISRNNLMMFIIGTRPGK